MKLSVDQKRVLFSIIATGLQALQEASQKEHQLSYSERHKKWNEDLRDGRVKAAVEKWLKKNAVSMFEVRSDGVAALRHSRDFEDAYKVIVNRIIGEAPEDVRTSRIRIDLPALGESATVQVDKALKPKVDAANDALNAYVLGNLDVDVMAAINAVFGK